MSWSLEVKPRKAPAIFAAIDAAEPSHELSEGSLAQLRVAKTQAKNLIEAQVAQGTDDAVGVRLNGHSNPGFDLSSGAPDYVQVTVTHAAEEASS